MPKSKDFKSPAADLIPQRPTLSSLKTAAADCQACDLWKTGTQTVFGEGARRVKVMLIGEQPGKEEDLSGSLFVGPAGRLLDDALEAAGIERKQPTSPMWSNISNGNHAVNAASTKNPTRWK